MFIDTAQVHIKAGRGGDGLSSFRHEKFVDRGGPDGGDGGNGGDIVFEADEGLNTLQHFRHKQRINAPDGQPGKRRRQHGRSGEDTVVRVPVGTVVHRDDQQVVDLTQHGQTAVIAFGGHGGFGNAHFTSSTRQAPRVAEKGEPGEEFEARLELKLLADVGLIGLPNVGKSTLLSVISNARPEIANYPFTTLAPNLGVADIGSDSLLVADIPGLIEGASSGKGLGDDFLRHIERTAVLVHLIDAYSSDVAGDYQTINDELKSYKVDLSDRPQLLVLSKTDGLDKDIIDDQKRTLRKASKATTIYAISSVKREGLDALLKAALSKVKTARKPKAKETTDDSIPVITLPETDTWQVRKHKGVYEVSGGKIERFAARTDFDDEWGIVRLKDIMTKLGIMHELERQGAEAGDTITFPKADETIEF